MLFTLWATLQPGPDAVLPIAVVFANEGFELWAQGLGVCLHALAACLSQSLPGGFQP
jgi:hypothetical protein